MSSHKERIDRMKELMKPIDRQIMMCDDKNELLMLASIMLTTSKQIFRTQLGEEGSRELFGIMFNEQQSRISVDRKIPPEESF